MLPFEFEERMKELLGDDFDKFIASYSEKPVRSFRVNTNKIYAEEFESINPFGGKKIKYSDNSFYFDYDGIGNHPYHHAGMIYIQEPGAMSAVASVEIEKDWNILDMCAAPGGKSIQAGVQNTDGVLVSNEIIPSRCKILTGNIERMGFRHTVTTCADAKRLSELFSSVFDLVIVDAPCSGEGMFRKDETAVNEWSIANVENCVTRQKEILSYIKSVVKVGGYLLYSTCTFSLEENEKMVDWFLRENEDFELVPVKEEVKNATADGIRFEGCQAEHIEYARRFYPHISKGEGQFVALLHKKSGYDEYKKCDNALGELSNAEKKIVYEFLDDTLTNYNKNFVKKYKENIVYFPCEFDIPKGIAFSCGVTIGTIQKNYIKPHHQFFSALGSDFKRKINLSVDEADKYLFGNTVDCECDNGWAVVCVDNVPLGGAKVVNGTAKNHYPKGLRKV